MQKYLYRWLVLGLYFLSTPFSSAYGDSAVSERLYLIQQDGRHAMIYTTSRSDYSNYSLWFNGGEGLRQEDYLKDFLYLFPDSGSWDSEQKNGFMVLKLPQGNFASLKWTDLKEKSRLHMDSDGIYYFRSWNSNTEKRTSDGHFGMWNSPGDFDQITCSWVFPENLEPVTFSANRDGKWVQRHNTLTYYGNNVNDLVFDIQYRPRTSDTYRDLKNLEGEGVEIEQQPTGVKLTLAETLLFPSGIAGISKEGIELLNKLAENLKKQTSLDIVIAGHTDNIPIGKQLAQKYPTNWELSSARAINIIHYLVNQGVAETRFQARAFSFMQPLVSNESEAGRKKNRRIEILLTNPDLASKQN